jgi:anti-sigma regulatory factor (Ser/Thr protein kinase)
VRTEARWHPDITSAAGARRWVAIALVAQGQIDQPVIDAAVLMVSELVSNAMRHARTEIMVALVVEQPVVRVEVFDRDTRPPSLVGEDVDATSGRGLHIVAGLASDWGWQSATRDGIDGKVVWAEIGMNENL